jgi:hypothetical protein
MMRRVHEVHSILTLCIGGIDREGLLKKTELAPRRLDQHLEVLLVKQLIVIKDDRLYITQRGHEFLANYPS